MQRFMAPGCQKACIHPFFTKGDENATRTTMLRCYRLSIAVVAVLQPLRWRLGAQLFVDDLASGRGVVSM